MGKRRTEDNLEGKVSKNVSRLEEKKIFIEDQQH